jgi:ABC-type polar amino acid transport system ATPase subunit
MLKVKQLSLTKNRGKILEKISLEIPRGRISLLLGKSGSGKTSLLRCIAQLEQHYEGQISCDDQRIDSLSPANRCGAIGFVPQSYALFPHMTVLENGAQPLRLSGCSKKEAEQKVLEILQSLDMGPYADRRPSELSGGQQQRAAIARALALDPDFLLFDEPTSALDPENTEIFLQILQRLRSAGKGIVVSSQDMAFAGKMLDRAFFLENGTLVEQCEGLPLDPESRLKQFLNY